LITFGCTDKKHTDPDEILDYDEVYVTLIDNWDLWEYQTNGSMAILDTDSQQSNSSREVDDFPVLVEELYANIETHKITIGTDFEKDSTTDEIHSVHMMDYQIWTEDEDENPTYYYDYFYNEASGALWLHEDTTPDIIWSVDPTIIDTIYVGTDSTAYYVNGSDYTLLFRHGQGPMLTLIQPGNDTVIPIPDNDDLDDLTPKFKWNAYNGLTALEYTLQVRQDTLFTQSTDFVIDTLLSATSFEPADDLENFQLYYWRVKAEISDWSEIWHFATKQVVLLSGPTNNGYVGLRPTLLWEELPGASGYVIQLSQDVNFDTGVIEVASNLLHYTPYTLLESDTKYYWRVKGDNSGDNWSDTWNFTTSKRISMTSAQPVDEKTWVSIPVEFSWGTIPNTSVYEIQISEDSLFANVDFSATTETPNYVATDLLTEVQYFWRVNCNTSYDWSDTLRFTTNTKVIPYSPAINDSTVGVITEFKWYRYEGNESVYTIQVCDEETFSDPIINSRIYLIDDEVYCDTASRIQINEDLNLIEFIPLMNDDLLPNTQYFWRVLHKQSTWSDIWNFTTLEITESTNLTEPTDESNDVVPLAQFKWEATAGSEFYRLQISLDDNMTNPLWINNVTTDRTYTLDDSEDNNEMLLVGETYYWRARSDRTNWSDTWSFVVRTGVPYDIEAISIEDTPNKVDLSWECLSGEYTDFWIERSDNDGLSWIRLGSVTSTIHEFVDFNLFETTPYLYRIRSEYPLGFSDYSDPVSVTTETFVFDNQPSLVSVTGDTFDMGSTNGDGDEAPIRNITLTNDFQIGKYEISNIEYCELLNWALGKGKIKGIYSSNFNHDTQSFTYSDIYHEDEGYISFNNLNKRFIIESGMESLPAVGVTWFGAIAYTNWISIIEDVTPLYSGTSTITSDPYGAEGYRLPTEAEWEFAATNRGNATYLYSGSDNIDDVAWYIGNSNDELHEVGLKTANDLDLYDMSGNAWEWCNDIYGVYDPATLTDPIGPAGNIGGSTVVVVRGGSWEFDAYNLRNTNRSSSKADLTYRVNTSIGFRIVKINP
jgi:formylglycine-generating enzyme required for sulfatase activity